MYSYGPLHMAEQKQGDQLEPIYRSSMMIQGVALRTCRKRWTMGSGGERGSGIFVLMARQDDDDSFESFPRQLTLMFFFIGVRESASLLKSPGLFWIFWTMKIMLLVGWSPLVFWFPSPPAPIPIPWWLYWEQQSQLVSPSLSCSIVFFQFSSKVQAFIFFFRLPSVYLVVSRTAKSTIRQVLFFLLTISRSGRLAGIRWSVCIKFWVVHIPFVRMVKFKFIAQFPLDQLPQPVVSSLILFLC